MPLRVASQHATRAERHGQNQKRSLHLATTRWSMRLISTAIKPEKQPAFRTSLTC
jgi:hypothetical protein